MDAFSVRLSISALNVQQTIISSSMVFAILSALTDFSEAIKPKGAQGVLMTVWLAMSLEIAPHATKQMIIEGCFRTPKDVSLSLVTLTIWLKWVFNVFGNAICVSIPRCVLLVSRATTWAWWVLAKVFVSLDISKMPRLSLAVNAPMTATTVMTIVNAQLVTLKMIIEYWTMRPSGASRCQATTKTELSHALLVRQPAPTAFPQHFAQIVQPVTF